MEKFKLGSVLDNKKETHEHLSVTMKSKKAIYKFPSSLKQLFIWIEPVEFNKTYLSMNKKRERVICKMPVLGPGYKA